MDWLLIAEERPNDNASTCSAEGHKVARAIAEVVRFRHRVENGESGKYRTTWRNSQAYCGSRFKIVVLPLTQKLVQVNGKAALYNSAKVSMASATTATPATTTTATNTSSAASAMQTTNTRTRTRNH